MSETIIKTPRFKVGDRVKAMRALGVGVKLYPMIYKIYVIEACKGKCKYSSIKCSVCDGHLYEGKYIYTEHKHVKSTTNRAGFDMELCSDEELVFYKL